jgi:hypothetical protein
LDVAQSNEQVSKPMLSMDRRSHHETMVGEKFTQGEVHGGEHLTMMARDM